jgi:hypothetical protein
MEVDREWSQKKWYSFLSKLLGCHHVSQHTLLKTWITSNKENAKINLVNME